MKQPLLRAVLVIAALVTPAFGQLTDRLVCHVPFDFQVGATKLPKGDYSIHRMVTTPVVRITTWQAIGAPEVKSETVVSLATPSLSHEWVTPKLVFHRYPNNQYFLSTIIAGRDGMEFRRGHDEIVTSTLSASVKPEVVTILARLMPR